MASEAIGAEVPAAAAVPAVVEEVVDTDVEMVDTDVVGVELVKPALTVVDVLLTASPTAGDTEIILLFNPYQHIS